MKAFRLIWIIIFLLSLVQKPLAQRQIEIIDRGLVAARINTDQVFISWRLLGTDSDSVAFNLYKGSTKLNSSPITNSTNYIDATSTDETYSVAAIINGVEQPASASVTPWTNNYFEVPMDIPAGGKTPDNVSYTYSPNDCSVGDVDGDGQYEIIVKWDPSNSKDNSQGGYTGNVLIDAYKLDGTKLWRIDLGINIRAGAHYTQYMVYDFDGDGKAELACKTAPNTKDGDGNYLSNGPAANDNNTYDYRNSSGYILTGPEYLTIFNGQTGAEMATVNYNPPRGTVSSWGDDYGNRVDRFNACVAYLDGEHPSLVMARGYYTRTVLAAWDWDGTTLSSRWVFDSNTPGNGAYYGQGNHNLSVADVDSDGKDEIIYGSCTIDNNGQGLYSTGLGHGDALHVSDMDPNRPGLEVFMPHEEGGNGMSYRDAATGEILFQLRSPGEDNGRGVAADIDPNNFGYEFWSAKGAGVHNLNYDVIGSSPSMNFVIYWDDDLSRELLSGTSITKYNGGTLLSATDCYSNNGTKATPNLQADIFGDWREEAIWRTSDNSKLRIYTTTTKTNHRFTTLMHDPQYRLAIAWQNVGYNQPPHLGYFLGEGMNTPPIAPILQAKLKWVGSSDSVWNINNTPNWKLNNDSSAVFNNSDDVLFTLSGNNSSEINITESIEPSKVNVISPTNYTFNGIGKLSGAMELVKSGSGTLKIKNSNDFSGKTVVSEGLLELNGELTNSHVFVQSKGTVTGEGLFNAGLTLKRGAVLYIGNDNLPGTSNINNNLTIETGSQIYFDLSSDTAGIIKPNDKINISGDITVTGKTTLFINKLDTIMTAGTYTLINFTGSLNGSLNDIVIKGIREVFYELKNTGNSIVITISLPRNATSIVWDGLSNNKWDLMQTSNWKNNGTSDIFVVNDTVLFNEEGNHQVIINEEDLPIGNMEVNCTSAYNFSGNGFISGNGGIIKNGTGYMLMDVENNTFSGPVTINAGYFDIKTIANGGIASSIGTSSSDASNLTINGGIFRFSGTTSYTNRGITIGENGGAIDIPSGALNIEGAIKGTGTLKKYSAGTLGIASSGNPFSGNIIIEGGKIELLSLNANNSGLGTGQITIKNGTLQMYNNINTSSTFNNNIDVPSSYNANLILDGRSTFNGKLTGKGNINVYTSYVRSTISGDWSAFEGRIQTSTDSDGGLLIMNGSTGYGKASIELVDNITMIRANSEDKTIDIGELKGSSGSKLGSGGQASNTITWRIGTTNTSFTFDGIICNNQLTGSGSKAALIKAGSGRMTLTNSNTYTGGTTIEKGNLIVNNTSGSGTGTGSIFVQKGGVLSGNGIINGSVTVASGGYLSPGISTVGNVLQINNSVTLQSDAFLITKVDNNTGKYDVLKSTGTVTVNGTLYIYNVGGTFKNGDSFKVIQAANIIGSFTGVYPASPGDSLYWDLSSINTDGTIKVTDTPTGVNDKKITEIRVYPNPVKDLLNIENSNYLSGYRIKITDLTGLVLFINDMKNFDTKIDFSSLPKGIYIVNIYSDNDSIVKKVIKE